MDTLQLEAIAHELQTQDNFCTAHPIFVVMEKVKSSPILEGYGNDIVEGWFNQETHEEPSLEEVAEAIGLTVQDFEDDKYNFKEQADKHGYNYFIQEYYHRAVNAHFTREAAEHHIKINGHNLRQPFVYVLSLWRCPEMIALRDWLKSGEPTQLKAAQEGLSTCGICGKVLTAKDEIVDDVECGSCCAYHYKEEAV